MFDRVGASIDELWYAESENVNAMKKWPGSKLEVDQQPIVD